MVNVFVIIICESCKIQIRFVLKLYLQLDWLAWYSVVYGMHQANILYTFLYMYVCMYEVSRCCGVEVNKMVCN